MGSICIGAIFIFCGFSGLASVTIAGFILTSLCGPLLKEVYFKQDQAWDWLALGSTLLHFAVIITSYVLYFIYGTPLIRFVVLLVGSATPSSTAVPPLDRCSASIPCRPSSFHHHMHMPNAVFQTPCFISMLLFAVFPTRICFHRYVLFYDFASWRCCFLASASLRSNYDLKSIRKLLCGCFCYVAKLLCCVFIRNMLNSNMNANLRVSVNSYVLAMYNCLQLEIC